MAYLWKVGYAIPITDTDTLRKISFLKISAISMLTLLTYKYF